jgi:regulator of sigma E protease
MEMVELIQSSEKSLSLAVVREGDTLRKTMTPDPETGKIGIYPVNPSEFFNIKYEENSLAESIGQGWTRTKQTTVGIIQGFSKMIGGSISVRENLGGPVAIAALTKKVTERAGFMGFWQITALLSVTLAIMNILPIPVLDGGHLVFLIYEGIMRREPSAKVRMVLQQIGFILLIGLLIFVTFNDILRQFGG